MSGHSYETGRLNLPFVGISTFGKRPYVADWSEIDADVAVLGAPFDFGTQFRAGARFGPRAVREASMLFSFGHAGAYDHEDDATYLPEVDRYVPILGAPFAARYPTSHQLDLRVERTWQRRGFRIVGFIDVANTYRNGRVVRYQYDPSYATRKPIEDMIPLPSVGVRAER